MAKSKKVAQYLWFIGLWLAGVLSVGFTASLVRFLIFKIK